MSDGEDTYIRFVCRESVVYTCRQDDHIVLLQLDPHPIIISAPNVEISLATSDVPNLLILMQMLMEKHFHFVLISIAHLLRRYYNFIAILVAALCSYLVNTCKVWQAIVVNTQLAQSLSIDCAARIVWQPLVALIQLVPRVMNSTAKNTHSEIVVHVGSHLARKRRNP